MIAVNVVSTASYRLYHHPLDAPSRRVRLVFAEKSLNCDLAIEKPWDPSDDLFLLNPCAELPVLTIEVGKAKHAIAGSDAICEYLEETHGAPNLLGKDPFARAEVRRLIGWFERKFQREVTDLIAGEKAFHRLSGKGEPSSQLIRAGCANIRPHLDYIGFLIERRNWLAGEVLTHADLAAASQLSVIDYLGDVPWDQHIMAKEWYARIKSRPTFRGLLGDHIAGFPPPRHYANLDF